jgi:ribonuclease BN (tRNA processing enzyme)
MPAMSDPGALSLTPIGVGAAYARPGEAQSCYLVRAGETSVVLDLGAGALNRLQSHVDPSRLDLLAVSHAHPDHCADLLALRVYMAYGPGRGRSIRALLPEGLGARLRAFAGEGGWDWMLADEFGPAGGEARVGPIRLVHREVPHTEPTHAMRVEANGRSAVYGADGVASDALAELADGCDLLVLECSFGADAVPEGSGHMGAADAARLATRARAGALLLTHCFPEHDRDEALRVAREGFPGPVAWAEQGRAVVA